MKNRKLQYVKISVPDRPNFGYLMPMKDMGYVVQAQLGDAPEGAKIILTLVEMTEAEYEKLTALPKMPGWERLRKEQQGKKKKRE